MSEAALVARSEAPTWTTAQWGIATVIVTEGMVFAILLAAYFFLRAAATAWPPPGTEVPALKLAVPFSFVLWASSLPTWWAERAVKRGHLASVRAGLAVGWVMGVAFLAATIVDVRDLHYGWRTNAYSSAFYTIVGLHAIHLIVGLAMSLVVQAKAWTGRYSSGRYASLLVFSLYWHFVDVVWLAVFPSLYLSVRIT